MGEYAYLNGERIKLGTCEDLMYLRLEDAPRLEVRGSGDTDPTRHLDVFRFRFPFPDEDGIQGGHYDAERGVTIPGLEADPDVDHFTVQFRNDAGLLVSLPCPQGAYGKAWAKAADVTVHRNGYPGSVDLTAHRVWNGRVVPVLRCRPCRTAWRLEEPADAVDLLEALDAAAEQAATDIYPDESRAVFYRSIADRVRAGYDDPPTWVQALATA